MLSEQNILSSDKKNICEYKNWGTKTDDIFLNKNQSENGVQNSDKNSQTSTLSQFS